MAFPDIYVYIVLKIHLNKAYLSMIMKKLFFDPKQWS
jgi:hypothetical protein